MNENIQRKKSPVCILVLRNLVNQCISSDLTVLNRLHEIYPWIPGADQIRPDPTTRELKQKRLQYINETWASVHSYILHTVFGKTPVERTDGALEICLKDKHVEELIVFRENEFPYQVGPSGRHFILWTGYQQKMYSNEEITREIEYSLNCLLGSTKYVFAWYENPKMTVPEFYHVQVFWRPL